MRLTVDFHDQGLELEVQDEHLVAAWSAPAGHSRAESAELIRTALEAPRDFPPLRQTVVPGDRVTIAMDPSIPDGSVILTAIAETLREAGAPAAGLTVLLSSASSEDLERLLPPGTTVVVHDPADRSALAYLATTKEGRRIYLSRHLTDADVVVPVGRVGFDPILGYCGPWSVLFPGLTDRATIADHWSRLRGDEDDRSAVRAQTNREESLEVSWLLGTLFHVGVIPGATGIKALAAGRERSVGDQGIAWLDEHWTFRPTSRAQIVVAGIGGAANSLESLAEGLATARRLVQHGGKIVILSQAAGSVGPALRRLIDSDAPEQGRALLRGHEKDEDFPIASRIADAVAWADVFLYSRLARELVEDLSMVALDKPDQARRLVAQAGSVTVVSRADRACALVQEDGNG